MLCVIYIFLNICEGVRFYCEKIEASMCYVGVIDVYFFVVVGQFVKAVNNSLCVINLILYIFCRSLRDINGFF